MDNALNDRTPQIIAAEINSIKDQTGKMLLYSAIEVGRRLTEAKALVNHGEWLKWLENSVSYSKSTAENLMRIFEEYGTKLPASADGNANSQSIGNLSYTQAVILLGIPEQERETFVAGNDVGSMSTQQLKQAVKERDQSPGTQDPVPSENEDLQKVLDVQTGTITQLTAERDDLRNRASSLKSTIQINEKSIKSLQQQLDAAKKAEVSPEKVAVLEKDLKAARAAVTSSKVAFHYENVSKGFDDLLKELTHLAPTDPEAHQKYRRQITELMGKITEKL